MKSAWWIAAVMFIAMLGSAPAFAQGGGATNIRFGTALPAKCSAGTNATAGEGNFFFLYGNMTLNGGRWCDTTDHWAFMIPLTTLGDLPYMDATPALARLPGNITALKKYLSQTGTGAISAVPVWSTIDFSDLAGIATVPQGGTGLATLTQYCAVIGAGTANVHFACPGASGTVLTSNGVSVDPTFQTAAGGSFYQTFETNGTPVTQRAIANFDPDFTVVDSGGVTLISLAHPVVVASGGTGQTTYTNGQLLIGDTGTTGLDKSTLTPGAGILIANGAGTITLTANIAAGSGCTNCAIGPDPNVLSGVICGVNANQTTGTTIGFFGTNSTTFSTVAWPFMDSGWVRNIGQYINGTVTANQQNYSGVSYWSQSALQAFDIMHLIINGGSVAGSYVQSSGFYRLSPGDQIGYVSGAGAGGGDTVPREGFCAEVVCDNGSGGSTKCQPLGGEYNNTIALSTTNYLSLGASFQNATNCGTTERKCSTPIPFTYSAVRNLAVKTTTTQGAVTNVCTVMKNAVAQTLVATVTVSAAAGLFFDTTHTFSGAALDYIDLQCVEGAATSSTIRTVSVEVVPDPTSTYTGLLVFPTGAQGWSAGQTAYFPASSLAGGINATETIVRVPIVRSGTLSGISCMVVTAPANTMTMTIMKNGVAGSSVVSITSGATANTVLNGSGTDVVAKGDYISLKFVTGAGAVAVLGNCSIGII